MIKVKRAYESPDEQDGYRVLVDRIWPRGVTKQDAAIDRWLKEIAPSTELRKWFGHDPEKWQEFRKRFEAELAQRQDEVGFLSEKSRAGNLTLVFAAKDVEHNNAVALKRYLESL
jgi:uncharacterized protein YeaO (DUF488 family)